MINKIILFGGTFDPVHNGHIIVAKYAVEYLQAETLMFVLAKQSPLKSAPAMASNDDRREMLKLAMGLDNRFKFDDSELSRSSPSYSIDTVRHFREIYSCDVELCWLIGADIVPELPRWHKIAELMDICTICVVNRGGYEDIDYDSFEREMGSYYRRKLTDNVINTPSADISSSKIREKIQLGQSITDLVSQEVQEYIERHKLYLR